MGTADRHHTKSYYSFGYFYHGMLQVKQNASVLVNSIFKLHTHTLSPSPSNLLPKSTSLPMHVPPNVRGGAQEEANLSPWLLAPQFPPTQTFFICTLCAYKQNTMSLEYNIFRITSL